MIEALQGMGVRRWLAAMLKPDTSCHAAQGLLAVLVRELGDDGLMQPHRMRPQCP